LFALHCHGHAGQDSDYVNSSAYLKNGFGSHTNTKEDVGSSEEEFRDEEEEEERDKDGVSEEDIWSQSQVGPFQVPQHHEIIPLSILGCDQQNMEKILCDFKWAGHRLAHIFADGWSTGSHKREMALLEALIEKLLFYYKDIKQEIVHTLLLEEYGVSKKWVIIMDRRQDLNVTSTPAGKSGPSAQDR